MKIQKIMALIFIVCLFVPLNQVMAGQCDDLYKIAKGNVDTAKTFASQKNYQKAQELYLNAASQFERAAAMNDCSTREMMENSRENAEYCRNEAAAIKENVNRSEANEKLLNDFNQAKDIYNQGVDQMNNHQWLSAISSFDQAAALWNQVAAEAPPSDLKNKALFYAKDANDTANHIREYKKKNLYR
jgi:hypothetical protein